MTTEVTVKGMTCEGCESVVETAIELLDGVDSATADRYEDRVVVEGAVDPGDVAQKVELAGYRADPSADTDDSGSEAADETIEEPLDVDDLEE